MRTPPWLSVGAGHACAFAYVRTHTYMHDSPTSRLPPADTALQGKACRVLGNCAFSPEGEQAVATGGCVGPIATAMRAHPLDAAVQEEACDALLNLVGNEAGADAMRTAGCLALVDAASRAHPALESARELLEGLQGAAGEQPEC